MHTKSALHRLRLLTAHTPQCTVTTRHLSDTDSSDSLLYTARPTPCGTPPPSHFTTSQSTQSQSAERSPQPWQHGREREVSRRLCFIKYAKFPPTLFFMSVLYSHARLHMRLTITVSHDHHLVQVVLGMLVLGIASCARSTYTALAGLEWGGLGRPARWRSTNARA